MTTDHGHDESARSESEWEALARYLAGESTPAEAAAFRRALESNADDAALVNSMDRALNRLNVSVSAQDIDVDAAFERVNARRRVESQAVAAPTFTVSRGAAPRVTARTRPVPVRRAWIAPAIAAAAVLAIGIGAWRSRSTNRLGSESVAAATTQSLRTGVGQRDSIMLSDGSRVVLAPMSEFSFAANTTTGERVATLVGEGYFDVVHDEAHPFVVRSGDAEVRDIGTSFLVHGGDAHDVTVVVTAGVVELGSPQGPAQGTPAPASKSSVRLEKGDVGVRHTDGRTTTRRGGATNEDVAWTRGALVFRDASFRDVADRVHRWYGIELRAADGAIAGRTVTADITGEDVDRVLQVLSLSLGAEVQRQGSLAVFRDADRGGGGKR